MKIDNWDRLLESNKCNNLSPNKTKQLPNVQEVGYFQSDNQSFSNYMSKNIFTNSVYYKMQWFIYNM